MRRRSKAVLSLYRLVFFAIYSVILIVSKEIMSFLPNIEPVSIMLILLSIYFGIEALIPVYVFAVTEIFLYGFGFWSIAYLYVWTVLVLVCVVLRKFSSAPLWCIVSAIFGLLFGTLCSLPYFIAGGWGAGLAWIVSGLPYDLVHCAGNGVIAAVLFKPLNRAMKPIADRLYGRAGGAAAGE